MEHNKTKENLARLEHEQWSHWMVYIFSKCEVTPSDDYIIPAELAKRWLRQINTKYKDLSEEEKESDRGWAQKALKAIKLQKLLKEEHEFGRELGANYVLNVLLEQGKITQADFLRLSI